MPTVQYATLSCLSQILDSVPEGRDVAQRVNAELRAAVSQGQEAARRERERLGPHFDDRGIPRTTLERIDVVPPELLRALREAQPVLEAAAQATEAERPVREACAKLRRISALSGSSQTIHAVLDPSTLDRARDMARPRVESPALRFLERMIRLDGDDGRTTRVFSLDESVVHRGAWPGVLRVLSDHFGSEVTQESLSELFRIPHKDYRIGSVMIRRDDRGNLRFAGEIRRRRDRVGFFDMLVPPAPPRGRAWSVKVEAISLIHTRLGIGSQLLARVARFLHGRGVHAMTADAMENAGLFCVFNGFRLGKALYEEIVGEFVQDASRRGVEIPQEQIRRLLDREANLAELAAFEWRGERIGRDFLQGLFMRKYLPVKFELSADKQSWLRLLSNLHRSQPDKLVLPLEWESLSDATRRMLLDGVGLVGGNVPHLMSSDRDHAVHLMERLNNWAQPISMAMGFPPDMLNRMPDGMRAILREKAAAIADVFRMLAADPTSPLFSQFQTLMSPDSGEVAVDSSGNRGFFIARTFLAAEKADFIKLPEIFRRFFESMLSRMD
ncbi:MAG TPA: hypothetical protein VLJ37_04475 [bacterium]|nr:hypothetical protein [bacterium]